MVYKLVYTKTAQKDLDNIEKQWAVQILRRLDTYASLKNPLSKAKKLRGFSIDTYRFRVGDYRAIFRLDKEKKTLVMLVVLKIRHRKKVY